MYENWTLLGSNQNQTFFGDVVEKCARVRLHEGQTFVIPSGIVYLDARTVLCQILRLDSCCLYTDGQSRVWR
jgi:hypothetical protein